MSEILVVPHWEYVWWDLASDREFHGAITGTMGVDIPFLEKRYVEKGERLFHAPDVGLLVTKWETRWEDACSYTTLWKECKICGKKFDVQEM